MRSRSAFLPSPHWCKLAADFYLTVKVASRHESVDSEEDREGLGCHVGQGWSHSSDWLDYIGFPGEVCVAFFNEVIFINSTYVNTNYYVNVIWFKKLHSM